MEKHAVYAGTFDPVTNGHLDIIRRGSQLFSRLIVGVACNLRKTPLLSVEERIHLLRLVTAEFPNVEVIDYEGTTVGFARRVNADVLLRGLRNPADFHLEFQMAVTNNTLDAGIETVFLCSNPQYAFINSCLVREVAASGGDISPFVDPQIAQIVQNLLRERSQAGAKGSAFDER